MNTKVLKMNIYAQRLVALVICLVVFFCLRASAQSYAIDWSTIDGGGGTSTGGVYSVSGTIGQPDAGHMSGGNYSIDGGFWGIVAVVQSPDAPLLTVTQSGASTTVSWPSPSTGFVLQQNLNIANTNGWSNFAGTISSNVTTLSVTIAPASGNKFFRLKK